MKKLLLASTALFALSGITAAAAQVDIAGNVRFHYEAWSDGIKDTEGTNNNRMTSSTELNFSADTVSNSGLRIQPYARLTDGGVTKRYVQLSDDWGTLIVGAQSSPAGSLSLDADWRDTVSGASRPSGNIVTDKKKDGTALPGGEIDTTETTIATLTVLSARNDVRIGTGSGIGLSSSSTPKIIYLAPTVNSLKIGVSLTDAGDGSGANITEYGLQYTLPERWGVTATLGYVAATRADSGKVRRRSNSSGDTNITVKDKDGASNNELGVLVTYGDWQGSFVRVSRTTDLTTSRVAAAGASGDPGSAVTYSKVEDSGTELEVIYNAADNLVLNAVIYNGKGGTDAGPVKGDKFSSMGIGAKYTIAPGLYASLGWNSFDYTDGLDKAGSSFKGSAYRLRLNADF